MDPADAPLVGRLVRVKRRFEDYLAQINNRTKELDAAAGSISADTAILLEAMDRSLTAASRIEELLDTYDRRSADRLDSLRERIESSVAAQAPSDLGAGIDELLPGLLTALDTYDRRSADRLDALRERLESAPALKSLQELVAAAPDGLAWRLTSSPVGSESLGGEDAELHLCSYLAGLVSDSHAIDVGAHRGVYTRAIADQGMTVLAVEPNPEVAKLLRERFAAHPRVVVRESAAGERRAKAQLFLARATGTDTFTDTTLYSTLAERSNIAGLQFAGGPTVQVETVDEMRRSVDWAPEIGVLKIDVEGLEHAVLLGLGETRPQAIILEFWGPDHMLVGRHPVTPLAAMVETMFDLGYRHWVSVIHDNGHVAFALNNRDVPPTSWGNCFWFRSHEAFLAAVRWCGTSMPEMIRSAGGR